MVKAILYSLFLTTVVWATSLEDKIESFIGVKEYKTQKNLIHVLFKEERAFLKEDGSVDDIKVLKKLKENGLLKFFYKNPQSLNISFVTKDNPLIFMKVINESLSSMGYSYFLTKRVQKNLDSFIWDIVVSTEHIVDPLILSERLEERGCFLELVQRKNENEWLYKINSDSIKIEAIKIQPNRTLRL